VRDGSGHTMEETSARGDTPAVGAEGAGAAVPASPRTSVKIRLADGSESDCRAWVFPAREAHQTTIFRDIAFSEKKARAIYERAVRQPERYGLVYAVPGVVEPLAKDGLFDLKTRERCCKKFAA